jgi:anti-anti-sigma factor
VKIGAMHATMRLVVLDPLSIIRSRDADGALRLMLDGELDVATTPTLAETLIGAVRPGQGVVLDMRDLDFIDSSGLRLLLKARADASRDGWSLWIANAQPSVIRLFEVSGTLDHFRMHDE